jgi:hypothetical protein
MATEITEFCQGYDVRMKKSKSTLKCCLGRQSPDLLMDERQERMGVQEAGGLERPS